MPSQPSDCPACGKQGRYGFDDDWCHDDMDAAIACSREGWYPGKPDPKEDSPVKLTTRQRTVLQTLRNRNPMTADRIGVRSDVLWRLEERGLVARTSSRGYGRESWYILQAGHDALDTPATTTTGEETPA